MVTTLSSATMTDDLYADLDERLGSRRSARVVLPIIFEHARPASVIDVGCGVGSWLAVSKELGVRDVLGVDVPMMNRALLKFEPAEYIGHDLALPFKAPRMFDLALSLEVAAYLPPTAARTFVTSLTAAAPMVLFSSAIPFQDLSGSSPNQQWPEYWIKLFDERGFDVIDCVRQRCWNNDDVEWWFAQNTFLYVRRDYLAQHEALKRLKETSPLPLPLVHPRMFLSQKPLHAHLAGLRFAAKIAVKNRISRFADAFTPGLN